MTVSRLKFYDKDPVRYGGFFNLRANRQFIAWFYSGKGFLCQQQYSEITWKRRTWECRKIDQGGSNPVFSKRYALREHQAEPSARIYQRSGTIGWSKALQVWAQPGVDGFPCLSGHAAGEVLR
jgi:hypothetical protein